MIGLVLILQIRDRQLCFSMGVPVVINDADYDVEELTMDDFPDDEAAIARYIILSVELNQAGECAGLPKSSTDETQSLRCIFATVHHGNSLSAKIPTSAHMLAGRSNQQWKDGLRKLKPGPCGMTVTS